MKQHDDVYDLSMDAMLALLQEHQLTGRLSAMLSKHEYVLLVVEQGELTLCHLVDQRNRPIASGQDALARLRRLPVLTWTLQLQERHPAPPSEDVTQASSLAVPHHLQSIQPTLLSRKSRRAYNLVDGRRTIKDIALILGQQVEDTMDTLCELEIKNIVKLR